MFGVKAAQPGYDVKDAPDSKMAFSSQWQTLRILKEGSFSLPANLFTLQLLYSHNLNYAPLFWVTINRSGSTTRYPNDTSRMWNTFDPDIVVDEFSIKAPLGGAASEVRGRYIIFENPLVQNYQASTDFRGFGDAIDVNQYGIRTVLNNSDFQSKDKRNFGLDSSTRTPLVHIVKSGSATANQQIEVRHDLGQLPEYMLFVKLSSANYWQIATNSDDSAVTSNDTVTRFSLAFNCQYSLWILKQPITRD